MKISEITLIDSKSERVSVNLTAKILENGDLILEGQDLGNLVKETFGDSDYEYVLKIKAEFKDTMLLNLIKERFANDSDFRAWLDEKGILSEFWSF
jgi:6-pyruvoyl-tetrahydropterin synthase